MTQEDSREKAKEWLSGIERHKSRSEKFHFDVSSSALLVLDMQNYFLKEDSHAYVPSSPAIIPNVIDLVDYFRKNNRPVIFTRHSLEDGEEVGIMSRWWRDVVKEGTPEAEIASELKPENSERVIRKTRYSAFANTDLEKTLRDEGVRSLVISGVTTHLCCDSTARDAFMKDFEVYFVVDATVSWTEDLHLASLKTLSDGFVMPVSTDEIVGGSEG